MNKKEVHKHNGKIEIPTQLREFPGARFILIDKKRGKGKKPKEKKWNTEKNYDCDAPALGGYIYGGGNYGVATGFGWLCCFDADEYERLLELGVISETAEDVHSENWTYEKRGETLLVQNQRNGKENCML